MPFPTEITPPRACATCGASLIQSPIGWQCLRCSFALATMDDDMAQIGDLFPELRLEGRIAQGGFGSIFRGEHRRMQRPVALKFLDWHHTESPDAIAFFEREMIHAGALDHPGIVRAYDAGERGGHWFIVMELIDGEDCGALARKHGRLPIAESCEIIRQAALALHHAHAQGLVHRDVKPGNLMITRGNPPVVKVLDFGLAGAAMAPLLRSGDELEGRFLGTLEYIAPEQIAMPDHVDGRADVYGLGATLRRLLTGQPLRLGASENSMLVKMAAVTRETPAPIASLRPDLPEGLSSICDRLVTLDREARPATAAEVASLLEPWCRRADFSRLFTDGPLAELPLVSGSGPRRRWMVPLAVAASAVALSAFFFQAGKQTATPALQTPPTPAPVSERRPVFSADLARERRLEEATTPRLLSADWRVESETPSNDQWSSTRMMPDGRLVYLRFPGEAAEVHACHPGGGDAAAVLVNKEAVRGAHFLGVSPDSGNLVWGRQHDPRGLHLVRARPDGTLMPVLRYDFPAEFPPMVYEAGRAAFLAKGETVADGYPWGFAVVAAGQVPQNSGLSAGDILIADEGHREFVPGVESRSGLWRCRFDQDLPASRLGALDGAHYPCDVTVSHAGVFLLSRTNPVPIGEETDEDLNQRLLRWDLGGFHPCRLDRPIYDPCGIAADPLSDDIYVAQGGLVPSASVSIQQIFRLRPIGQDRYSVEVIAERFGRLSSGCLGFSTDGRLIVTDSGNRVVVVLERSSALPVR